MPADSESSGEARIKLIRNERAKLSTTYIDGAAGAVLAVGGLAPVFAQKSHADPSAAIGTAITSVVCVVISAHPTSDARTVLRGLR